MSTYGSAISEAVATQQDAVKDIWKLIDQVKRDTVLKATERQALLQELYEPLSTKTVRNSFHQDTVPYEIGLSFRSQLLQSRQIQTYLLRNGYCITPPGNPKKADRAFARMLGIPAPQTFAEGISTEDVPIRPLSIVKPKSGASARGVFYVDSSGTFISIRTQEQYQSLMAASAELRPRPKSSKPPRWVVEEAILGPDGCPANDLKVYMFYGEPALVLGVQRARRRGDSVRYCPRDPGGNFVSLGPNFQYFESSPLPDDLLEKAQTVSRATPAPFIRADFHAGVERCYLGEITPHPGGVYAEDLYEQVDKDLGRKFADAQARLLIDLLQGKSFETYFRVYDTRVSTTRR